MDECNDNVCRSELRLNEKSPRTNKICATTHVVTALLRSVCAFRVTQKNISFKKKHFLLCVSTVWWNLFTPPRMRQLMRESSSEVANLDHGCQLCASFARPHGLDASLRLRTPVALLGTIQFHRNLRAGDPWLSLPVNEPAIHCAMMLYLRAPPSWSSE